MSCLNEVAGLSNSDTISSLVSKSNVYNDGIEKSPGLVGAQSTSPVDLILGPIIRFRLGMTLNPTRRRQLTPCMGGWCRGGAECRVVSVNKSWRLVSKIRDWTI